MFNRLITQKIPNTSFFLFGPRQVGKTTALSQMKTLLTLDLLNPKHQLEYTQDPNLLVKQVEELTEKQGIILIDEIQRVPHLLDIVHLLMEKYPPLCFILCGSSARKLRHGASNLLGGRALYKTMHPLTMEECGKDFNSDWVIKLGSLPKIYSLLLENKQDLAKDLLRSYVITYLQEEIKAEALVRNLQGFQNFLDIAASQFAKQVNFSEVGKESFVAYATVREYYAILEDTLMGFFLPPYLHSEKKRMSHSPKFYFFDNGVTRALLGTLNSKPGRFEKGLLFEQWFIQEVFRLNAYYQKDWKLFFWRTSHGAEVDLMIERGQKLLCAIECKYKSRLSGSDLSGIRAFKQTHPLIPCFIVSPVEVPLKLESVSVLPPQQAIKKILRY